VPPSRVDLGRSADLQRWFDLRCSHARDWPPDELARLKAAAGSRVSVVLPALDEERTVGTIVAAIRRDLVEGARTGGRALVDELVVVDSGSRDGTARVATAAGARVLARSDVLPEHEPLPGKGEVLWRGVAATSGDLVVFIDSDLDDFSTDFVTGLLGPLLTHPEVALVKATYDRPLRQGETVLPAGGGRVTELVARPLLAMFWPQLAGFIQPLSGEYAARRALLEQLWFPTGYGVEIGLLVDAWQQVGLDGLAQVDLVQRKHRNSDDAKLGAMASEIIQVVLDRLGRQGRISLGEHPHPVLTQFRRVGEQYHANAVDVTLRQRPPLMTVPGYAAPGDGAHSSA
jgi:glucosyl-3-phosphoglycerate synthase